MSTRIYLLIVLILLSLIMFQQYWLSTQKHDASTLSSDYISSFVSSSKYTDKEAYHTIMNIVKGRNNDELRDSLVVGLADTAGITMYGKYIARSEKIYNEPGRMGYNLHPYAAVGASSTGVIIDSSGRVLLGRKRADLGPDLLILPGGYMKPHPVEGAEAKSEHVNYEEMDKIEEAILRGEKGYSNKISMVKEKDYYDNNLYDTLLREVKEETGISVVDMDSVIVTSLGTRSDYGVTNDPRLHTIVEDWMIYINDSQPHVKAGDDIAELFWVNFSNVTVNKDIPAQKYPSKVSRYSIELDGKSYQIRDDQGEVIEKAFSILNRMKRN